MPAPSGCGPLCRRIFRAIKTAGKPLNFHEIYQRVRIASLQDELDRLVFYGYLTVTDGKYWPTVYLEKPMSTEDRAPKPGYFEYEKIQGAPVEGKTGRFFTPFYRYLPWNWNQGGRGTCVGHAAAILAQTNYLALTGDNPTDEDRAQAAADIERDLGSCKIIFDKWYHSVFSPQWLYHTSRIVGNVTVPSGSFCSAAIKAMKQIGAVTWDKCLTSKTVFCAPVVYPYSYEDCEKMAVDHKLDGYATITTFQALMEAIEQSYCVLMPINLEYDYLNPTSDCLWKVHPCNDKAGSHALPWIAVDWDRRWIGCWNSWGGQVPQVTWIDEQYWKENAGPGFVSLDKLEVLIARDNYAKITIDANVPCTFYIDGVKQYGQPVSVMLEIGRIHEIKAVATDPASVTDPEKMKELTPASDGPLTFTFTKKTDPSPHAPTWFEKLLEKLAELLKNWRR